MQQISWPVDKQFLFFPGDENKLKQVWTFILEKDNIKSVDFYKFNNFLEY